MVLPVMPFDISAQPGANCINVCQRQPYQANRQLGRQGWAGSARQARHRPGSSVRTLAAPGTILFLPHVKSTFSKWWKHSPEKVYENQGRAGVF
jgi:hypothetical protein